MAHFLCILLLSWFGPASKLARADQAPPPPRDGRPYVVVIDPGHGGDDTGTTGCGIAVEKEVALAIAQRLRERLLEHPGIEVLLTRERDEFVALKERIDIAQRAQGDVFVSIHANSAPSPRARGAEVYFLSVQGASDQAAEQLADRENAALLVPRGRELVEDDDLLSILVDLQGSGMQALSSDLAERTLMAFEEQATARARAVKQAGFAVLRTLSMPSILVEVGFLSHRAEAERLNSDAGQERIARAMADAIVEHLREHGEHHSVGEPGERLDPGLRVGHREN